MKASGMGLGESDDPPAQELLSTWPELCRKYDIPCSAMHVGLVIRPSIYKVTDMRRL